MTDYSMLTGKLDGRVAIVTGGGRGIGLAIARRFAQEGARVAVVDIDGEAAETAAAALGGIGIRSDVSDPEQVEEAFARIQSRLGPMEILVNNAGITGVEQIARLGERVAARGQAASASSPAAGRLDATVGLPDVEWDRMIAVNLSGVFYGTRAALRRMQPRRRGVIINIASTAGIEGSVGFPHYSAAKAGVIGLTRSVAKEVAPDGIRVNAIAPGHVLTPLWQGADAILELRKHQIPLGRLGSPDEIAAVAAFLASDDASFVVGQTISPNGGYLAL